MVYNVVNGQGAITDEEVSVPSSPLSFNYAELWSQEQYNSASDYSNYLRERNGKAVVFPGYMNRNQNLSYFDSNSVRLADAAFFSSGAFHLELGNNHSDGNSPVPAMLDNEFFPSSTTQVSSDLRSAMKVNYDFAVAYENLLSDPAIRRNGHDVDKVWFDDLTSNLNGYGGGGSIWFQDYRHPQFEVLHFINLTNANDQWRNARSTPTEYFNKTVHYYRLPTGVNINKCYLASPDRNGGAPQDLGCTTQTDQYGAYLSFQIPDLMYWDMVYFDRGGQY